MKIDILDWIGTNGSMSNCGLSVFVWRRARDKKKNMADEKAQAQRRLLRSTKRHGTDKSEHQKQKDMLERRKEELVRTVSRNQRWKLVIFRDP